MTRESLRVRRLRLELATEGLQLVVREREMTGDRQTRCRGIEPVSWLSSSEFASARFKACG